MALCTTVAAVLWLRPVGRRFLSPCTGALSALALAVCPYKDYFKAAPLNKILELTFFLLI